MLFNSCALPDFIISSIIPIPKGARVALNDSEKYRSIAIGSLLSEILDHHVHLALSLLDKGLKVNAGK